MKLMVSSYNNGGVVWNAETEETKLRYYNIDHTFGRPAWCTITLADVDGSLLQKYNTDANDVYLGVGKVTLEAPTGTDIFYGRIVSALGDSEEKTVTLNCRDWLDQLDEELITYDMREKLNGNTRQSVIKSDYEDTDGEGIGPANENAGTFYVYDHDIGLTANAHNGQYMMLTAGMAGTNTWSTGPYAETVTPSAAPMLVDLFVGPGADDISYLWLEDAQYHSLSDGADWVVDYSFKSWVPDSAHYVAGSITGARVHLQFLGAGDSFDMALELYNGATYDSIGRVIGDALNNRFERTYEIPEHLLAGMHDANGEVIVRINCAEATGGSIRLYYIDVEIDTTTTGYSTAMTIADGETYRLTVDTDLSADATKVWDGVPYCVAEEIYLHFESATGPILGGDGIVTLTCGAANVENTSGISTRQFKNWTRLRIANALAEQDKSVFWMALGGTTVTYKQTFGADTVQLTDSTVNKWQSLQDYGTMINSYKVYGARIGDYEIYQLAENAASKTKFLATRSRVLKNTGLVTDADALAIGTALAARDCAVQQMVACTISGNTAHAAHDTTIKLGDVVEITSSYLWPTAAKDYIVVHWAYDSKEHETYLHLHPKVSIGLQPIDTLMKRGEDLIDITDRTEKDLYSADPVTHVVS